MSTYSCINSSSISNSYCLDINDKEEAARFLNNNTRVLDNPISNEGMNLLAKYGVLVEGYKMRPNRKLNLFDLRRVSIDEQLAYLQGRASIVPPTNSEIKRVLNSCITEHEKQALINELIYNS